LIRPAWADEPNKRKAARRQMVRWVLRIIVAPRWQDIDPALKQKVCLFLNFIGVLLLCVYVSKIINATCWDIEFICQVMKTLGQRMRRLIKYLVGAGGEETCVKKTERVDFVYIFTPTATAPAFSPRIP